MKKIFAVMVSAILMMSMVGCGNSTSTTEKNDAKPTQNTELENFDIVLDWYPNAVHSFIYVAMEKGYYEEEGLNVNVQFPANANDAISLTAAGKADAGLYYQAEIISTAINQNIPVVTLGTVVQHPLNIVMSMKDKGISSAKDLKGKVIGYPGVVFDEILVRAMMKNNGMEYSDVTMQDVGFDLNSALITGNVDAVIGGYINHEYPSLIKEGYDVTYFNLTDEGIPDFEELVLVTGKDQAENESEKLQKFIRASKKGFADVLADPEAALQTLLKYQDDANYPLDEEIEKASMEILLPLMTSSEQDFLEIDKQSWADMANWLNEQGLLDKEANIDELIASLN